MSEENEARIVVSTSFESMRDFVEFTKRGLDDIKGKGKGTFDDLGKEVTDFTKTIVGGTFISAGQDLARAVTSPLHKGFGELMQDAEAFRRTVTQTAIAAGQDLRQVGADLKSLSRQTGEGIGALNQFISGVTAETGDREGAVRALPAYRKEAIARGMSSVTEMMPLAGTLQRRWGISSVEDTERFFNEQRAGAKRLGVNPNQAAALFQNLSETFAGAGMSAEKSAQFSNTLLHMAHGDQRAALQAGQEFTSLVQNAQGRGQLENALGLKQGALLDDMFRPDVARAIDLVQRQQTSKRGQKGFEYVARQHMSGPSAALLSRGMRTMRSDMAAQMSVEAGEDLADADRRWRESAAGKAAMADAEANIKNIEAGEDLLPAKDKVREHAGGWGGWLSGRAVEGIGLGGVAYAGKKLLSRLGGRAAAAAVEAGGAGAAEAGGAAAARAGLGALGLRSLGGIGMLLSMEGEQYTPEEMARAYRNETPMGPPDVSPWGPMSDTPSAAPPAAQDVGEGAKRYAKELRDGQPIPIRGVVTVLTGMRLSTGQGEQK